MSQVPGTFNGTRYEDLRVLIIHPIKAYYVEHDLWDKIVAYRGYEFTEVITVKIPGGLRKDKWRCRRGIGQCAYSWYIALSLHQQGTSARIPQD